MRKQVESYLKDAYGKERARPDIEDGHFTFGKCIVCFFTCYLYLDINSEISYIFIQLFSHAFIDVVLSEE